METKTTQMKTNRGNLFRTYYSKGVGHHHLGLAETQRQAREWGHFIVEKGRLQVCSDWRLLTWGSWRWANYK